MIRRSEDNRLRIGLPKGSLQDSTIDLFQRYAGTTITRAQALREAMLALIDGPGLVRDGRTVVRYAHPIFWAPFSLVGDGGGP